MPTCSVNICKNKSNTMVCKTSGISYHRFPKDPEIKVQWIHATGQSNNWVPTEQSVICSKHFEDDCFLSLDKEHRLCDTSVPTLKLKYDTETPATQQYSIPERKIITPQPFPCPNLDQSLFIIPDRTVSSTPYILPCTSVDDIKVPLSCTAADGHVQPLSCTAADGHVQTISCTTAEVILEPIQRTSPDGTLPLPSRTTDVMQEPLQSTFANKMPKPLPSNAVNDMIDKLLGKDLYKVVEKQRKLIRSQRTRLKCLQQKVRRYGLRIESMKKTIKSLKGKDENNE